MNKLNKNILFLFFALFISCNNNAQNHSVFNKIPIDTVKWSATDTFRLLLNNDRIVDMILIFDKYRELTRPKNVQTPILFYLGEANGKFTYFDESEDIICFPYFDIKVSNNEFIITQNGIQDDNYIYTNVYKYENNKIIMKKEIVIQKIEKLKVNEETGDVTTVLEKKDTIYSQEKSIPLKQYNFLDFVDRFR